MVFTFYLPCPELFFSHGDDFDFQCDDRCCVSTIWFSFSQKVCVNVQWALSVSLSAARTCRMNFADTRRKPRIFSQNCKTWVRIFRHRPSEGIKALIAVIFIFVGKWCQGTAETTVVYPRFSTIFLKYLYHPNTVHQLSAPSPNGTPKTNRMFPYQFSSFRPKISYKLAVPLTTLLKTKSHMHNTYFQTNDSSYSTPKAVGKRRRRKKAIGSGLLRHSH